MDRKDYGLKQGLQGWMIFFIVMSVVIGAGIFNNGGSSMRIAGPGGALLAFAIMSVIAICVSECISELVQLFAVPNAIVEYVRYFVDQDFGWAIGIAYWLTYSSIFAAQNMMAAQLSEYWGGSDPPQVYRVIVFYVVSPIVMLVINLLGVSRFGWVEAIGGGLKVVLVLVTTLALYIMAGKEHNNYLQDSFQHNEVFVTNNFTAVCYVIPIMAFGFIGIETIAVTAFEAAPDALKRPSRYITYFTALMYLLCMLSQCFNIQWTDEHLPRVYGGIGEDEYSNLELCNYYDYYFCKRATQDPVDPSSRVLPVIAMFNWERKDFAGLLNGAIIFSVLSASNTTLYVASRTLYGMALRLESENRLAQFLHKHLSTVDQRTKVPVLALILSWASFFWIPFMSLKRDYTVQYVIEIIQTAASVSCLIVWTALCFAYLRLWNWQRMLKNPPDDANITEPPSDITPERERYARFNRNASYKPWTVLISLQPIPAIFGLIGCFATFVFCSATWWYREVTFTKVAIAYAAQFIVLIIFVALKAIRIWQMPAGKRRLSDLWTRTSEDDFIGKLDDMQKFLDASVERAKITKLKEEEEKKAAKVKRRQTMGESGTETTK